MEEHAWVVFNADSCRVHGAKDRKATLQGSTIDRHFSRHKHRYRLSLVPNYYLGEVMSLFTMRARYHVSYFPWLHYSPAPFLSLARAIDLDVLVACTTVPTPQAARPM